MDALYPINNNLLFFIEGCGQAALVENWGDGIATDPSVIQEYGISSPRPFFEQVITRPYVAQVGSAHPQPAGSLSCRCRSGLHHIPCRQGPAVFQHLPGHVLGILLV